MKLKLNERFRFLLAIVMSVMILMSGCELIDDLIEDDDNDNGIENGNDVVTDIDGNVYQTVIIGDQEWMAENLRVTRYSNGDAIPTGLSNEEWEDTTDGAYAIYDHHEDNTDGINSSQDMVEAYGKLYNWYAVDDARGLCPTGWRVPTDDDWTELVDYVVAQGYPNEFDNPNGAGNAIKSCRQVDHPDGGDCATMVHPRWDFHGTHSGFDEFGFSALPGGGRWVDGSFNNVGYYCYWWSSFEDDDTGVWFRLLDFDYGSVSRSYSSKGVGNSVRCVRVAD